MTTLIGSHYISDHNGGIGHISSIANLELMSHYGADAWKMYNTLLTKMTDKAQKQLTDIR